MNSTLGDHERGGERSRSALAGSRHSQEEEDCLTMLETRVQQGQQPEPAPEEPPDLVEIAEDRSGHAALNELLLQVPAKPLVLPPRILETLVMAHAGPADRLSKLPVTVYCVTEQVLVVKTFSAKVLESFSAL